MKQLEREKGRVLLVGAGSSGTKRYSRPLIQAGFDVAEVGNDTDALRQIEASGFDVVLLDLAMPAIRGRDLLRGLRARSPGTPVIVLGSATKSHLERRDFGRLVVQRLTKPIDPRALTKAVSSAVRVDRRSGIGIYRNRRGEQVEPSLFSATKAKNDFGTVLDRVLQGDVVVVTKHDAPKAVIISIEDYQALSKGAARALDALTAEFDALLDRMQTSKARAGMQTAFDASPEELGRAAVTAAGMHG